MPAVTRAFTDNPVLGKYTPQQRADTLLVEYQSMRTDPMDTVEVAVEQRLVGLFSATKALRDLSIKPEGRAVISRARCVEEIELVRDTLSRILDRMGGK